MDLFNWSAPKDQDAGHVQSIHQNHHASRRATVHSTLGIGFVVNLWVYPQCQGRHLDMEAACRGLEAACTFLVGSPSSGGLHWHSEAQQNHPNSPTVIPLWSSVHVWVLQPEFRDATTTGPS